MRKLNPSELLRPYQIGPHGLAAATTVEDAHANIERLRMSHDSLAWTVGEMATKIEVASQEGPDLAQLTAQIDEIRVTNAEITRKNLELTDKLAQQAQQNDQMVELLGELLLQVRGDSGFSTRIANLETRLKQIEDHIARISTDLASVQPETTLQAVHDEVAALRKSLIERDSEAKYTLTRAKLRDFMLAEAIGASAPEKSLSDRAKEQLSAIAAAKPKPKPGKERPE